MRTGKDGKTACISRPELPNTSLTYLIPSNVGLFVLFDDSKYTDGLETLSLWIDIGYSAIHIEKTVKEEDGRTRRDVFHRLYEGKCSRGTFRTGTPVIGSPLHNLPKE